MFIPFLLPFMSLAKNFALLLGAVLTIVGILGFVLPSPLLGYFEVDTIHNVIHILSGVIGLWAAMSGPSAAKTYLIVFGLVYGLVAVLGFMNGENVLNLIGVNAADNWLHTVIAAACLVIGASAKR